MCTLRSPRNCCGLLFACTKRSHAVCAAPQSVLECIAQRKTKCRAVPRRRAGRHRSAKGRSEKMRLCIASHLLPPRGMPCTSLIVLRPDRLLAVWRRKIACVKFLTSGVSFSRCAFCFVSFARPANGEGKPSRNVALRAPTRTRVSDTFRFFPSLLHLVAASC